MNNIYYVYCILDTRKKGDYTYLNYNLDHEPFYIGKGKDDRMLFHLFESRLDKNNLKNNIIKKIIKETGDNPMIIKLEENISEEDAHKLEIELISIIGRRDLKKGPLANLTDGGEGMSGSLSNIGNRNHFYGKTHSDELKSSQSKPIYQLDLEGNILTTFESLKQAGEETNSDPNKISLVAKGKRNTHNGFKWKFVNDEDIISNQKHNPKTKFKYVCQYTLNDVLVTKYKGVRDAARQTNINRIGINQVLLGQKNTAGGFRWKYEM